MLVYPNKLFREVEDMANVEEARNTPELKETGRVIF